MHSFSTSGSLIDILPSNGYPFGAIPSWPGSPNTLALLTSSLLTSTFLLPSAVESFPPVTFISLQSSYAWYFKLSQFETVFLALIMVQICFFRYLEALPINLNNFFLGDPTGRKRRRKRANNLEKKGAFDCDSDVLVPSLLKVLKRLDEGNCVSRTLCEMEILNNDDSFKYTNQTMLKLPSDTALVLKMLKAFAKYRHKWKNSYPNSEEATQMDANPSNSFCPGLDGLEAYENAVLIGSSSSNFHNSSICEQSYSACALTKEDIVEYLRVLINAKFL